MLFSLDTRMNFQSTVGVACRSDLHGTVGWRSFPGEELCVAKERGKRAAEKTSVCAEEVFRESHPLCR